MNRLVILGVVVVAAIYVLFSSIYVVNEREQAIVLRFGQITDVKTEPGIYFKLPTTIVDFGADHRRPAAALRRREHDGAGAGRQVLRSRRVPHLSHQQSAAVPSAGAGRAQRSPRPVSVRCSSRRCARSTVCVSSTRRCRANARR